MEALRVEDSSIIASPSKKVRAICNPSNIPLSLLFVFQRSIFVFADLLENEQEPIWIFFLFSFLYTQILATMKNKLVLFVAFSTFVFLASCKKDNTSNPQINFANNVAQGTANANGEYTLTGHISSQVSLAKVTLTKQGQANAFMTDESTAKNKNEYDYSYLITGINTNTTIVMDVYNQEGGKSSAQFVISK